MEKIQAIRGMNDYLPQQTVVWQFIERHIKNVLNSYGFNEIRLPVVEKTKLFSRAIGDVTDVVEKEMFSFNDRDDVSLSLRPEGTAGCVRAVIEHSMLNDGEQKLWYIGPMFRYERPQKGRYRQFNQLGVEFLGNANVMADAEIIMLTARLWRDLGIMDHLELQLNTIGSLESRRNFRQSLVDFLSQHLDVLDDDCKKRLTTNPLRILDSKNPQVQQLLLKAPKLYDYLDEQAQQDFSKLKQILSEAGIKFVENPNLVRGLDYYNKTVFEWVTTKLGAQGTVCGGGRYDGLVEQLGGGNAPAVGFATGLERLILLVQEVKQLELNNHADIFIITQGDGCQEVGFLLAEKIRNEFNNLSVYLNISTQNFKKQFKKADKSGAKLAIIIGSNELEKNIFVVKNLATQEQQECDFLQLQQLVKNVF